MRVEQREMRDSMPPLVAIRERGNTFSITSIHSSRASSSSELLPFFISYVRLSPGWGGGQAENSLSSRDPHVALQHRGVAADLGVEWFHCALVIRQLTFLSLIPFPAEGLEEDLMT